MKRRADEVQFAGARAPQRILTTQHSSASEYQFKLNAKIKIKYNLLKCFAFFSISFCNFILVGPNIQYHIGSGVLKTNESPNISGQTPTVQYTTCKCFVFC